jgi:hypothetical protein
MYNRILETDAKRHAENIRNLKTQAANRLKDVKKKQKKKSGKETSVEE